MERYIVYVQWVGAKPLEVARVDTEAQAWELVEHLFAENGEIDDWAGAYFVKEESE